MRILSLKITGLFGVSDYHVPMNREDRITILHGPNGFGKTTILRMVNSLFTGRYAEMRRIPFKTFEIELDNDETLHVKRNISTEGSKKPFLLIQLFKNAKEHARAEIASMAAENYPYADYLQQAVPGLIRTSAQLWRYMPSGEELTLDDVLEQFGMFVPVPQPEVIPREQEWLNHLRQQIRVRFIESQRLLRVARTVPRGPQYPVPGASMEPSVAFYSHELAQAIQAKLAEYAALSQGLDRSFPVRLVEQIQSPHPPRNGAAVDELRRKLTELEEKRSRLRAAGLLDKQDDFRFQVPVDIQETTQQVLPVYVEDVEKKLSVFDEIVERIDLLKGIINKRFFAKEMSISKENGFLFTSRTGQPLAPTLLSSGEQHMLVLLSELLFSIQRNSLVLIDEPEISLHVAWQQSFLEDLKRIADLSAIDILMATHSPQIIHDRWDLTVELAPQEQPA